MESRQNGSNKNPDRGSACGGSGAIGSGSKSAVRTPGEQQQAAHDGQQQQREDNRQPWNQRCGRPRTLYTAHGQGRGEQLQQRFQNPRHQFHRDQRKSYSSVNTPSPRHISTGQRFECPPNLPPEKKVAAPRPLASSYAAAAAMGTQYDPERHGQSSGMASVSVAKTRSASVSGSQRSSQIQKHKHSSPGKSSSVKKQKFSESDKEKEEQVIQILQRDERIKKKQEEALTLEKLQNLADKQHVIDSDVDRAMFQPEAEELIEIDEATSKSDKAMLSDSSKSDESNASKPVQKRSVIVVPEGSGAVRMLMGLSGQLFNVNAPEFVPPKQISGNITTVENVTTVVTARSNEFESLKPLGKVTKVTVNVEGKKEPGNPETILTTKIAKVYLKVNEQTREQLEAAEAAENDSDSGDENDNERESSESESESEQSEGAPRQKRRKTMKDIAANWKERRPTTAVSDRHIGEGKRINQKAKYLIIDAGPEYGIGLKTINSPSEAPDFIYIHKGKETTNWSELHHGFWVYTKEFNRRLMDDGSLMKDKTRAMQLDDLITVIPSQIAGKPNTEIFEPAWIVTNFNIQSNTTRNLLLDWPTYVLNNMRAKLPLNPQNTN